MRPRRVALLLFRLSFLLAAVCSFPSRLHGQIAFTTAIDLALRNSPRVKMAQDDVQRATAALAESRDYYIPSLALGGGLGQSFGFTLTIPTLFSVTTQSVVYSAGQRDYIRAARTSLGAARIVLNDVRQQVEEDTAATYLALDQARRRRDVLAEQAAFAQRLVEISRQRGAGGLESPLDQKRIRRALLQIETEQPQVDSDMATLEAHLETLTGVKGSTLLTDAATVPAPDAFPKPPAAALRTPDDLATQAAEANAKARAQQVHGDKRLLHIPQLLMQSQYGRISPFDNVARDYNLGGNYNVIQFGVALQLPIFDKVRAAKVREATADALHVQHDAELIRGQQQENRIRLATSMTALTRKLELAELDHEIASDQLDLVVKEVAADSASAGTGRQMTPEDEMFSHIDERQHELQYLDSLLELERAQLTLLRQDGDLETWIQAQARQSKP